MALSLDPLTTDEAEAAVHRYFQNNASEEKASA